MNLHTLSAVEIIERILTHARSIGASDIHIDPGHDVVQVRVRNQGDLCPNALYPLSIHHEVVARVKVLSGLRLDEHSVPQDGRFRVGDEYDARVVVTPSYFGEAIVIRLLQSYDQSLSLERLGFSKEDTDLVQTVLARPSGLILVAGATGSGKTTTLYTLLKSLLSPQRSVISIEDPIEYILPGARQIAVREGYTSFASVLRSVLRQDPNIIMVGEMRDAETARVAVSAALTGHTVLSTVHTHDAKGTITRLKDMGIEQYLIDATISLVIAQRLLRCVCQSCAVRYIPTEAEYIFISECEPDIQGSFVQGTGCQSCDWRGYLGRMVVYESAIVRDKQYVYSRSMLVDGIHKASRGLVSLHDVMSLIYI